MIDGILSCLLEHFVERRIFHDANCLLEILLMAMGQIVMRPPGEFALEAFLPKTFTYKHCFIDTTVLTVFAIFLYASDIFQCVSGFAVSNSVWCEHPHFQ